MTSIFWDHLVLHEELLADLSLQGLDEEEKAELAQVIDEIIHHHLLNLILSHLPKHLHSDFVSRLTSDPTNTNLLGYIKENVSVDIESEIKQHSEKIKSDIRSEIKKARTYSA